MVDLSVGEAAEVLGVDASRVRALLRSGALPGRQFGRFWVLPGDAVYDMRERPPKAGRPMAPRRAWALLDLLDGGNAPWLDRVARSQARALIRRLVGSGADEWRDVLRRREERHLLRGHPRAILRLRSTPDVWPAGPERAEQAGADLMAVDPVPELYVRDEAWSRLPCSLHLSTVVSDPLLIVRVPKEVWPFADARAPGRAVLAASLLDGREWRAVHAGTDVLNGLAERFVV